MRRLILAVCCCLLAAGEVLAAGQLLPNAQQTFTGPNGVPLSGGFVFTYLPSTTTPKMTWQDSALSVPNTNPVQLDANGQARIWTSAGQVYRQVVLDANSSLVWDQLTATAGEDSILTVANNTELEALVATNLVYRQGFAAAGDGGDGFYVWNNSACSLNGGAGDNGSQVKPNNGVGCRVASFPAGGADARAWGVITDGVTDVSVNLQNAILWVENAKGILNIAGSSIPYLISTTMQLGNGGVGVLSALNDFVIRGVSSGVSASEMVPTSSSVIVKWIGGTSSSISAFQVNGPISGIELSGLKVDCNLRCGTGFNLNTPVSSNFKNLLVENYIGPGYVLDSVPTFAGFATGTQHNLFTNLRDENPGPLGNGILIGPAAFVGGVDDPAQNTFINSQFTYDGTSAASYGIGLQFTDNMAFITTSVGPKGGVLGCGVKIIPPVAAASFPAEIAFYNSAIGGGVCNPGAGWTATHGIGFFPYPTTDGEPIPVANVYGQFYGYTTNGVSFGITGPVADMVGNSGATPLALAGGTFYVGPGCSGAVAIFNCAVLNTYGGFAGGLFAEVSNPPGVGETYTFTVYSNGGAKLMTCVISGAVATACSDFADISHHFVLSQGDYVNVKVVGSGGAASVGVLWAVQHVQQ